MANLVKAQSWIALLLMMALSLGACMPVMPEGTPAVQEDATAASSEEATPEAADEPTAEAAGEATAEVADEATTEPSSADAEIGVIVSEFLAQELQISVDQVEVVSVEAVEWPDACLGVNTPDTMCAQVITPGYRVTVTADGQEYEVHTNSDGSSVQLATEP